MKARLCVLHVDAGREWRGGQQQALYLMQGLSRLGHDSQLVTPPGSPLGERAADLGFRVHGIKMHGDLDVFAARSLRRVVAAEEPDIVHYHDARGAGVGALIRASALPATVASRRVDFPIRRGWLSRRKYLRCDRIAAVSERVREICVNAGLPPERVAVIHDGVDVDRFRLEITVREARALCGLPERGELIGVAAALVDHKGHRFLIEAMPRILARHPSARLCLAGEGPLREPLESLARERGVRESTDFLGHLSEIPAFLRSLDVFVLPSHLEGLGQALIEAMATGLAVVATATGGIPDIVNDGRNGLLVPPRDPEALASAISRLLDDDELRRDLAERARAAADGFRVEAMVRKTEALYDEILRQRA